MTDSAADSSSVETRPIEPASVERLRRRCDPALLDLTASAPAAPDFGLGQTRSRAAIELASRMRAAGYNLFVMGSPGSGARRILEDRLAEQAASAPTPSDWVYVNNFEEPNKPIALELPPGRAVELRDSMAELIEDLSASLPAVFESEDYRSRRDAIEEDVRGRQEEKFQALAEEASGRGTAIVRTPMGFSVAPAREGRVVKPEEFQEMSPEEQKAAQEAIAEIQEKLVALMRAMPAIEKERREAVRALDQETAMLAIGHSIETILSRFADLPRVIAYVEAARRILVEHAAIFMAPDGADPTGAVRAAAQADGRFTPFQVNVLISRDPKAGERGAPIVHAEHPTLQNLIGRVEHIAHQGALVTNFTLIKPGDLHRANGGYLLLDARLLFSEPFAWPALKRVLRAGAIRITPPAEYLGFASTVSLEPEPIPLSVKVAILGERIHYYLLSQVDPDFAELFKVVADVDEAMERTPESERETARFLTGVASAEGLRPLEPGGAARLIEHASRAAGDAHKLSLELDPLIDRMREADFYAGEAGRAAISAADVDHAIEAEIQRVDRIRDRAQESILRDIALVSTDGAAVGQVNGLAVSQIGGFAFGRPSRITARARAGAGKLVDIEREVELGGPIHSKGVLILSSLLSARFLPELPLSLAASIVFEQSYGGVDGDSASCAEYFALLSAIAELPLRQDLAITGSVNQHGESQAIGGANEKIEGFFDICAARGLTGRQGVMIPASNMQHLMLREDVVEACAAGRFAVYPYADVDEGMALLSGRPAGRRGEDGAFPEGSVNRLVEDRLTAFAEARRRFAAAADGAKEARA